MIEMTNVNEKLTLCEVLRIINDRFQGDDERSKEIRDLLCLGLFMAKRMARKLREHNEAWDADWLWANEGFRDMFMRKEKEYKFGSKEEALKTLEKIAREHADTVDTVGE